MAMLTTFPAAGMRGGLPVLRQSLESLDPASAAELPASGREGLDIDTLMLKLTFELKRFVGTLAAQTLEIDKVMVEKMTALINERIKTQAEELKKNAEAAAKARKAGILGVVIAWAMAAVDAVIGVAKVVGGFLSANPMMVSGGFMNIASGALGIAAAAFSTLALLDERRRDKWAGIASKLSCAAMSVSIAAAFVDITSALRNALLAHIASKATKQILANKSGAIVGEILKSGGNEIFADVSKRFAKQVSEQVGTWMKKEGVRPLLMRVINNQKEMFAQIEKIAEKSFRKGAGKAFLDLDLYARGSAREIGDRVLAATQAALEKSGRRLQNQVLIRLEAVNQIRATAQGAGRAGQGVLNGQRAELRLDADKLRVRRDELQTQYQHYEQDRKENNRRLQRLIRSDGDLTRVAQDRTRVRISVIQRIANMA
ncbi:Secreted effector protein SseC [Pandoraea terrae]|uniref:Secreted effector protein SseC n=1 Tax=Pandoraea terrae TaxID=1537710 RepID=A0A5E4Y8U8_9BURK|nr:type III secretion system translocon subunit SctE [Pandoraea terrae]VVE45096.1 Secreted effector protein SseC [Pandoraea terrae]